MDSGCQQDFAKGPPESGRDYNVGMLVVYVTVRRVVPFDTAAAVGISLRGCGVD